MRSLLFFLLSICLLNVSFSQGKAGTIVLRKLDTAIGEKLFKQNCNVCHSTDEQRWTGPGLKYATTKYEKQWLYKWVQNPGAMIKSGDKQAIAIFNEFGQSSCMCFELTPKQIDQIFQYIDNVNKK